MIKKSYLKSTSNLLISICVIFLLFPSKSFAALGGAIFGQCPMDDPGQAELECVIGKTTDWALGIIGAIIVLIIIIAGMRYILSAGNPTQAEGAKKTLVGAIIGLIIVVLSKAMVQLVINIMSGTF